MPAIDTRGPYVKKPKAKKVYGPPKPKPKVYGPPAPKPKPVSGPPTPIVRIKPTYGPPAPKPKKRPVAGPARPKHKQAAGPPKPTRKPRKQTAAEKTNARISERGAKYLNEYLKTRPISDRPENTIANVEKFKGSRKYTEALVVAKTAKEVQDSLKAARKAPGYTPKVAGVPIGRKVHAKDVIDGKRIIKDKDTFKTKGKSLAELLAMRDAVKPGKDRTKRIDKYASDEAWRKARVKKAGTTTGAAGLKILDYTLRGGYASAGAASAIAKGKNPVKVAEAAGRGVIGKDKKTYSTVLTEVGWKPKGALGKAAKGVVSFGADVALDPTTYATFGVGSVASHAAAKAGAKAAREAAERASKAALAAGASVTEAKRLGLIAAKRRGTAAAKQAAAAAPKGKGLTVKFVGKEVPGVRRATAAYSRADRKLTEKVVPAGVRAKSGSIRTGLRKTIRPMTRPPDVKAEEWVPTRQAERRSRAHVSHEDARAQTLAREVSERVPDKHYEAVIDALERNRLGKLPDEIRNDPKARAAIHNLRSAYREAYQKAKRAGGIEHPLSVREFMDKHQKASLKNTISAEERGQKRGVTGLKLHEARASGKLDVATEAARGSAERHAAVATEHARGKERKRAAVETERSRGQAAVETTRAQGHARLEAAVETVRARGQAAVERAIAQGKSKAEVQAEQHKADIALERAKADARVSAAKPMPAQGPLRSASVSRPAEVVKAPLRELSTAKTANDTAKTALRRAEGHLKRTLAKPKAQRRHIASAYAKVTRAQRRVEETGKTLALARETVRTERKRTAGVAPAEHQALLDAIEHQAVKRKPAPVAEPPTPRSAEAVAQAKVQDIEARLARMAPGTEAAQKLSAQAERLYRELDRLRGAQLPRKPVARVVPERTRAARVERIEPAAPKGARLEKAGAKHGEHAQALEAAHARVTAAKRVPSRSLNESDRQYLTRLHKYATDNGLRLVAARAEKLLAKEPKDLAKGYYPRDFDDRVLKRLGLSPSDVEGHTYAKTGPGTKVAKITPGLRRANQRRLSEVNPAREEKGQTPFSTNVPLVSLNYLKEMGRVTSRGEFVKELAAQGTPVKVRRGADDKIIQPTLKEGEALYHLGYDSSRKFGLTAVNEIPNKPNGQYVALNPALVKEMKGEGIPVAASLPGAKLYDQASSFWRKRAIASLSYHIRNAVSDINTAYLNVPGRKMIGQTGSGVRATAAASKRSKSWRPPADASKQTIKVAGETMKMDTFLKMARKEGVLDAGFFGAELSSMAGESAERVGRLAFTGGKAGRAVKRANLNRENTMRLVTFKEALDQGLKPADAADVANKFHIDYGDLTEFERRVLRRLTGFYTWTARSIPLHGEMLVKRPGKYATVEKLRQNIGNATTGQTEQERQASMTDAVLKAYPAVIGKRAISIGMTQSLLNELPGGFSKEDMKAWKEELERFGWSNLNPYIRSVIENRTGRNVVTKAEIEKNDRPLVAAPAWVQYLPEQMKGSDYLNVTPPKGKDGKGFVDPKTGQPTWAWNGRRDWQYDQLMLGFIGQAAALANSGRSPATKEQAIGAIFGARIDPLNAKMKERAELQSGAAPLNKLKRAKGILNQQGIDAEHPTPEWKRLNDAINKAEPKAKKKPKKSSGGDKYGFGGGGGSTAGSGNKYGF